MTGKKGMLLSMGNNVYKVALASWGFTYVAVVIYKMTFRFGFVRWVQIHRDNEEGLSQRALAAMTEQEVLNYMTRNAKSALDRYATIDNKDAAYKKYWLS